MATQSIAEIQGDRVPPTSGDSYQSLLADVMREINDGLSEMPETERATAVAQIHAIAENVRKRQEQ